MANKEINALPRDTDLDGTELVHLNVEDAGSPSTWNSRATTLERLADYLFSNSFNLSAAYTGTITDDGTKSSGTYTPTPASGGPAKKIVNGGAFTLAPYSPASNTYAVLDVFIVNGGSSGAITTSGFTKVTGDAFTTTSTDEFACRITIFDVGGTEYSFLDVVAGQ